MTSDLPVAANEEPRTQSIGHCPLCLGADIPRFFSASDRLHGTPGVFTYCRCRACGTVFQNPRVVPEDLGACYPADYGTHQAEATVQTEPQPTRSGFGTWRAVAAAMDGRPFPGLIGLLGRLLATSKTAQERVLVHPIFSELLPPQNVPGGELQALDVGCGAGKLMMALSGLGWQVEGVEWDPAAAAVARIASGLNVREGDFRHLDLPPAHYDLIVLSHCFEHLDDPREALRKLHVLLKATGRLVLIYPNPESLGAKIYGPAWFDWDPPRHLTIPPLSSLAQASETLGFRVKVVRTLAREARDHLVHSRAIREGKPPAQVRVPTVARIDQLYAHLESTLTFLGFDWGEEAVLVLETSSQQR